MDDKEMISQFVKWAKLSRGNARMWNKYAVGMAHFAKGQANGYMLCARVIKGYATKALCNNKPKFVGFV